MPKTRGQKKQIFTEVSEKIDKAKSVIFTEFKSLSTKDSEVLRRELKQESSEYLVAKKTILELAYKDRNITGLDLKSMVGNLAAIFGYGDEVTPAKLVDRFRKGKEDKINFLGGILEGRFISAQEVGNLAKLPSRPELYAQLVGSLNAPVSGFVNALSGNLRNLVGVLNAIKDKK